MLLWLLNHLDWSLPGQIHALEEISLRACSSAAAALAVVLILGPSVIRRLGEHFREPNKSDSAHLRDLHRKKNATPTMGGGLVIGALLGVLLVFGDLRNPYLQSALVLIVGLTGLGILDDLTKLRGPGGGISARAKLIGQIAVATASVLILRPHLGAVAGGLDLQVPLLEIALPLGVWFVPLAVLVIVGSSNAVNLTDGLDGLAGGCLLFSIAAMGAVAYFTGQPEWARYLNLTPIPGSAEMAVLAGGVIGSVGGFLRFNWHPARVFMGDTGSLPLGGLLGLIAVAARQEILLLVIAGPFVVEAASVILQVGYYKWRQRRIFLCAPLHHHFQFRGSSERRIVVRFWIASAICAILGLAILNFGIREPRFTSRVESPSMTGVSHTNPKRKRGEELRVSPSSLALRVSVVWGREADMRRDGRSAHDFHDGGSQLP